MDVPAITPTPADSEHLKLLSIFHYVVGGMAGLFACIPIIHLVIGLVLLFAPEKMGPGAPPPRFIGMFLVAIALFIILTGWVFAILVFICGRFLALQRHYMFCLVMACVECTFMPFGTVLGVFTILVLARPTAKQLFGLLEPRRS
jgi:hypothetical protein